MSQFIYNQLLRLLLPLLLLRLKRKSKKQPEYGFRWDERLGKSDIKVEANGVLFHLASLGETIAATPIIEAFINNNPDTAVTITSTTPTGSEQIKQTFGTKVTHCYLPFDLPIIQRRFIDQIKPSLLVLMETELWPNLIRHAKRSGAQVMVINARLSERSAKGYKKFAPLTRLMMQNIDLVCAQFQADKLRFHQLGCHRHKIIKTGNIKFDTTCSSLQSEETLKLSQELQLNRPVWLAASTHKGEEEEILKAHESLLEQIPDALLILVPRHPDRFDQVYNLTRKTFTCSRRSKLIRNKKLRTNCEVLIGDSLGEMMTYIGLSDIVFVGGSLVERGGHNPFEAACQNKAIITGQHIFNFEQSYQILAEKSAVKMVNDATELAHHVTDLLCNDELRQALGRNAFECQLAFQGAQQKTLTYIQQQHSLAKLRKTTEIAKNYTMQKSLN